jgi:hypothetical protein
VRAPIAQAPRPLGHPDPASDTLCLRRLHRDERDSRIRPAKAASKAETVNPGIIWAGQYVLAGGGGGDPVNSRSGNRLGWIAQLHFFLDDLFPKTIGRPIFGK